MSACSHNSITFLMIIYISANTDTDTDILQERWVGPNFSKRGDWKNIWRRRQQNISVTQVCNLPVDPDHLYCRQPKQ